MLWVRRNSKFFTFLFLSTLPNISSKTPKELRFPHCRSVSQLGGDFATQDLAMSKDILGRHFSGGVFC